MQEITTIFGDSTKLSILKDPFSAKNITDVDLHWSKRSYDNKPSIWATVEFKNGNTSGRQRIEAESMNELIQKTEAFAKSLPG